VTDYSSFRIVVVKFGSLFLTLSSLQGCDEFLPPRIHPSGIEPQGFLEQSFDAEGGVVFYERTDTVSRSTAGTTYLVVKNLHDEVLSGSEDITIDVEYWLKDFPGDTIRVIGGQGQSPQSLQFSG